MFTTRLKLLLTMLLASVMFYCFAGPVLQSKKESEPKWLIYYGVKFPKGMTVLYDTRSIVQRDIKGSTYATGTFLINYKEPIVITSANGKPVEVRTLVKSFVVDCKSMIASPMYDIWFSADVRPTNKDIPVAFKDYNVNTSNFSIQRSNFVYQLLCGTVV